MDTLPPGRRTRKTSQSLLPDPAKNPTASLLSAVVLPNLSGDT